MPMRIQMVARPGRIPASGCRDLSKGFSTLSVDPVAETSGQRTRASPNCADLPARSLHPPVAPVACYSGAVNVDPPQPVDADYMLKRVQHLASTVRSEIARLRHGFGDVTAEEWATIRAVEPFTMTSRERLISAIRATGHLTAHGIPGDIVECGVWRGGSMMAIAMTLLRAGDSNRRLHLFDTFAGMTPPSGVDADARGRSASSLLARARFKRYSNTWCIAGLDDVQHNMRRTGYPEDRIAYVEGPVEQTIPGRAPDRIAMLRLDTDWYESTRHELEHLYPRVVPGGVLIIDDYGHWQGARRAVDEYFDVHGPVFLHRLDYTGRLAIKR
jgi:hypothetical protein